MTEQLNDGLWEVIGVRVDHECKALMKRLVALDEEETTLCNIMTQQERQLCKPGKELSPADTLSLYLPVSRTVRNKFLFFKLPSLWYLVMASPS